MGLLFGIFWLWVVIAGFKSVGRRLWSFFSGSGLSSGWSEGWSSGGGHSRSTVWTTDGTALSPSQARAAMPVSNQPALVHAPSDIWTPAERRGFGRKLAAQSPVSTDAVVADMERELARMVRNAAEVEKNAAGWRGDLKRIEAAQADWQARAGLAVDKGRDQLAKAALAEKAKLQPRADGLRGDIARLEELLAGYRRDIIALEAKLSESIRRQVLAETRLESAEDSVRARELVFGERTAAALSSLEQVERSADLVEGQAEALTLGAPAPGLAEEFAALERQDALDRELAALKAERNRPTA